LSLRDFELELLNNSETVKTVESQHWWFIPVILATQEAEIRRITVRSQPSFRIVHKTLSWKKT
jgi:hypothetical protein